MAVDDTPASPAYSLADGIIYICRCAARCLLLVLVLLVLLYQPGVTDMWIMDWEGRAVLEESGAPIGLCFIVEGE